MRWIWLALAPIVAVLLWLPGQAAQPGDSTAPPAAAEAPAPGAADENITFDQYQAWRVHFIEQRQAQLAARLAAANLTSAQRGRLEQQKAYYDWFAGLSEADRDRRFRERFEQIDANHDGKIDPAERQAWHEKQRALYDRGRGNRREAVGRPPQ